MSNDYYVDPSRENFDAFKALDRSTPILMLNKLKFYEHAKYEAGHPLENTPLTGAEPTPTTVKTAALFSLVLVARSFGAEISRLRSLDLQMSTGTRFS